MIMNNILSLYNPYYNKNVIELHLDLLKENGVVAFGKVRSQLRDYAHPNQKTLDDIYSETTKKNPSQLFLTDYSSIYVANVISVNKDINFIKVPKYYDGLEVEYWFVFDDLRLIIYKDFELIRDQILANFLATNFNNRTYTVYGNPYIYPMQVTMKEEINYFEKEDVNYKYYTDIFRFMRDLFKYLMAYNKSLESFPYTIQGRDYKLKDILEYKPNFGTYSYIIKSPEVKNTLNTYLDNKSLKHFIFVEIPSFVRTMQTIRNESVHGDSTSLQECNTIRAKVIGIGQSGILAELQRHGNMI